MLDVGRIASQGSITIANSGQMRTAIQKALHEKPSELFINLSGVSYMDSSALATLVEAVRIANKQGTRLVLAGIQDQPQYLIEVTHFDRLFDIAPAELTHENA